MFQSGCKNEFQSKDLYFIYNASDLSIENICALVFLYIMFPLFDRLERRTE